MASCKVVGQVGWPKGRGGQANGWTGRTRLLESATSVQLHTPASLLLELAVLCLFISPAVAQLPACWFLMVVVGLEPVALVYLPLYLTVASAFACCQGCCCCCRYFAFFLANQWITCYSVYLHPAQPLLQSSH